MCQQITIAPSGPSRQQNSKTCVSGGFRSAQGASRFAQLLSLTQTLRKQKRAILPSLTAIFKGIEGAVPFTLAEVSGSLQHDAPLHSQHSPKSGSGFTFSYSS